MNRKRRHEAHDEHPDESWLLPYSDLMTLLLALFIVLYAVSSVNNSKLQELSQAFKTAFSDGLSIFDSSTIVKTGNIQSPTDYTKRLSPSGNKSKAANEEEEQRNFEELQKQLNQYIKENKLDSQLDIQLNQSELLITIRDNALFASGSAAIKPEAGKLAEAIGQMLKPYSDYSVLVAGHTDNQPINTPEFPSNWDLSFKRAVNFMKILLTTSGLDPKNFSATAYGEFHPVDTNDTAAGRAKNRRVEVSILRKFTTDQKNPDTTLQVQNP